MRKLRKIPFRNIWILCVIGGVLTGTLWANLLSGELLGQVGYFDGIYQGGNPLNEDERRQLWHYVIRQRFWEAGLGGLVAMTPFAVFGYLIGGFGAGFVMAVMITLFTLEKGWMGLGYWLVSVMPHGLCYLAVWMILTAAVLERQDMKKIRIWLLLAVLIGTGSFLEAWINPELIKYF